MKLRRAERVVFVVGLTLIAVWLAAQLHRVVGSRLAIARFEAGATVSQMDNAATPWTPAPNSPVDFRLWSAQRIAAYKGSLTQTDAVAVAVLRIPKISLEVPVFDGTDDLTLNRGVGRIRGTARIGEKGNLGIAGHRDGFFRGLENIRPGDVIELVRPAEKDNYTVTEIRIVTPDNTAVLHPTPVPTLTLVTCYPFYFVGSAPKRYIVTARLQTVGSTGGNMGSGALSTDSEEEKQK